MQEKGQRPIFLFDTLITLFTLSFCLIHLLHCLPYLSVWYTYHIVYPIFLFDTLITLFTFVLKVWLLDGNVCFYRCWAYLMVIIGTVKQRINYRHPSKSLTNFVTYCCIEYISTRPRFTFTKYGDDRLWLYRSQYRTIGTGYHSKWLNNIHLHWYKISNQTKNSALYIRFFFLDNKLFDIK